MKVHHILAALVAVCATAASAQTLTGVKVDNASITAGGTVKATAELDVKDNLINCGMRINWGDGAVSDNKINQTQDVPMVATHQYAKPGTYTVMAEAQARGLGAQVRWQKPISTYWSTAATGSRSPHLWLRHRRRRRRSGGRAPAMAAATAAGTCPAGWKLAKPGVSKKTKSFTCTAKAQHQAARYQSGLPR